MPSRSRLTQRAQRIPANNNLIEMHGLSLQLLGDGVDQLARLKEAGDVVEHDTLHGQSRVTALGTARRQLN